MRARRVISVVGCHAEGEIGDVIVGGVLPPAGATLYAQMECMRPGLIMTCHHGRQNLKDIL